MIFWEKLKIQGPGTTNNVAGLTLYTIENEPPVLAVESAKLKIYGGIDFNNQSIAIPAGSSFDGPVTLPNGSGFDGPVTLPDGSGFEGSVTLPADSGFDGPVTLPDGSGFEGPVVLPQGSSGDMTQATIATLNVTQLNVTNPVALPANSTIGGARVNVPLPKNYLYIDGYIGSGTDHIYVTNYSLQNMFVQVTLYTDASYTTTYNIGGNPITDYKPINAGQKVDVVNYRDVDKDPSLNAYVRVQWKYQKQDDWNDVSEGQPVFQGQDVNNGVYRTFEGPTIIDWFRFDVGFANNELWFIYSCPFSDINQQRGSVLNMLSTMNAAGYNYVFYLNVWTSISSAMNAVRIGNPPLAAGLIAFRTKLA